ncbi:MAG: hypothetical protein KDD53_04485 [Bdellovibrionales bacterium]|nr:hypothetical protein [Bdellovibrionales bacterium]
MSRNGILIVLCISGFVLGCQAGHSRIVSTRGPTAIEISPGRYHVYREPPSGGSLKHLSDLQDAALIALEGGYSFFKIQKLKNSDRNIQIHASTHRLPHFYNARRILGR